MPSLHNKHISFSAALLGCSGYAGQETLDRVLAHPELEVIALGSNSLAGEPPSALDLRLNGSLPAFVRNEEALARGADVLFLCLGHDEVAALERINDEAKEIMEASGHLVSGAVEDAQPEKKDKKKKPM